MAKQALQAPYMQPGTGLVYRRPYQLNPTYTPFRLLNEL